MLQLPQFPRFPQRTDSAARPDSGDGTIVGRAAERIFADTLQSLPQRVEAWAVDAYAGFLAVLPRLIVALVAASLIIAVTLWLRGVARKGAAGREEESERGKGVMVLGVLVAVTVAALIAGAERIAAATFVFALFYAVAALVGVVAEVTVRRSHTAPEATRLALTVVRYAVLVLGVVEALGTLGLNLGGVIAGIGILGIAIGFAAQDSLANIIAGFMILWDESIHVGDWIRLEDVEGRIKRITLRSTRIETRDSGILVIPNKEITGSRLFNFSLRNLTRVRVPVDVNYDADIAKARKVMLSLLPEGEPVSARPDPVVAVTALGDHGVRMELVFFVTDPREAQPLIWRLSERILLAFRDADIEITYPHLNVHLRERAVIEMAGNGARPAGLKPDGAEADGAQPRGRGSSSAGISDVKGP